jgi:hypothetical protein
VGGRCGAGARARHLRRRARRRLVRHAQRHPRRRRRDVPAGRVPRALRLRGALGRRPRRRDAGDLVRPGLPGGVRRDRRRPRAPGQRRSRRDVAARVPRPPGRRGRDPGRADRAGLGPVVVVRARRHRGPAGRRRGRAAGHADPGAGRDHRGQRGLRGLCGAVGRRGHELVSAGGWRRVARSRRGRAGDRRGGDRRGHRGRRRRRRGRRRGVGHRGGAAGRRRRRRDPGAALAPRRRRGAARCRGVRAHRVGVDAPGHPRVARRRAGRVARGRERGHRGPPRRRGGRRHRGVWARLLHRRGGRRPVPGAAVPAAGGRHGRPRGADRLVWRRPRPDPHRGGVGAAGASVTWAAGPGLQGRSRVRGGLAVPTLRRPHRPPRAAHRRAGPGRGPRAAAGRGRGDRPWVRVRDPPRTRRRGSGRRRRRRDGIEPARGGSRDPTVGARARAGVGRVQWRLRQR